LLKFNNCSNHHHIVKIFRCVIFFGTNASWKTSWKHSYLTTIKIPYYYCFHRTITKHELLNQQFPSLQGYKTKKNVLSLTNIWSTNMGLTLYKLKTYYPTLILYLNNHPYSSPCLFAHSLCKVTTPTIESWHRGKVFRTNPNLELDTYEAQILLGLGHPPPKKARPISSNATSS
jgi:hypothetical protein